MNGNTLTCRCFVAGTGEEFEKELSAPPDVGETLTHRGDSGRMDYTVRSAAFVAAQGYAAGGFWSVCLADPQREPKLMTIAEAQAMVLAGRAMTGYSLEAARRIVNTELPGWSPVQLRA